MHELKPFFSPYTSVIEIRVSLVENIVQYFHCSCLSKTNERMFVIEQSKTVLFFVEMKKHTFIR